MNMPTNELARRTLLFVLGCVLLSYPVAVLALGPRVAIETGNVILLSLASGIVVAYAPVAWQALRHGLVDGAGILSIGIFASWLGVVIARGVSIVWRVLDKPVDWLDSPWWGIHIAASTVGAMCHLIAPEAVSGRVPTREWVRIGLMVAGGVFVGAGLVIFNLD
jgi:hypothetical protein